MSILIFAVRGTIYYMTQFILKESLRNTREAIDLLCDKNFLCVNLCKPSKLYNVLQCTTLSKNFYSG